MTSSPQVRHRFPRISCLAWINFFSFCLGSVGIALEMNWFEPEDKSEPKDWQASERAMQVYELNGQQIIFIIS